MKVAAACLLLSSALYAQISSHKETDVQAAYSRLSYSNELQTVLTAVDSARYQNAPLSWEALEKKIQENTLTITMSGWKLRSLQEFGVDRFNALALDPVGPWLRSDGVSQVSTEGDPIIVIPEYEKGAAWAEAQPIAITVADRVHYAPDLYKWVQEVATFTVTASFQGRIRTATAHAFFGKGHTEIIDNLVSDVSDFLVSEDEGKKPNAYPVLLLHGQNYDTETTRRYLELKAVEHGYQADLEKRLSTPLGTTESSGFERLKIVKKLSTAPASAIAPSSP